MKQLSITQFMAQFAPEVHKKIKQTCARYKAPHVVCFQNQQFDSSALGASTACPVGPNNTFKSPEDTADKWLNDLPSRRQYPVNYAEVPPEWSKEGAAENAVSAD